jgi:hypothetical protein
MVTKDRIIACRKRLRQKRTSQRLAAQPEGVVKEDMTDDLSALASGVDEVSAEDSFQDREAAARQSSRTFVSEVDRRPTLRAR